MSARDENVPHAVWSGSFSIFGVEVKCHTLSDDTRIIEAESLHELFSAMGEIDPDEVCFDDMAAFQAWRLGRENV